MLSSRAVVHLKHLDRHHAKAEQPVTGETASQQRQCHYRGCRCFDSVCSDRLVDHLLRSYGNRVPPTRSLGIWDNTDLQGGNDSTPRLGSSFFIYERLYRKIHRSHANITWKHYSTYFLHEPIRRCSKAYRSGYTGFGVTGS